MEKQEAPARQAPREEFVNSREQPVQQDQAVREREQRGERGEQDDQGLFGNNTRQRYADQWHGIQASFVDEPKRAVEQADRLVDEVIRHMTETFSRERQKLEGQWSRGDSVSTEDLRVSLQRYRQFFHTLLGP